MNRTLIILAVAAAFFFTSCDKESAGTINDFSNSVNPYAAFNSLSTIEATEGDTVPIKFVLRTAFNKVDQDVSITYDVSGAIDSTDQTIVIPRNTLTASYLLIIPDGFVTDPDPDATDTITYSITKAVVSDGTVLRVGLKDDSTKQKLTVVVYKP